MSELVAAGATIRRGFRLFAAPAGQPRARRGTDVVLLVASLLGVVLATLAYPPSAFERSLVRLLAAIPGWLDPVWMVVKTLTLVCFFIWMRATLPRLRYDQLMSLGWKVMLPLATLNVLVTVVIVTVS